MGFIVTKKIFDREVKIIVFRLGTEEFRGSVWGQFATNSPALTLVLCVLGDKLYGTWSMQTTDGHDDKSLFKFNFDHIGGVLPDVYDDFYASHPHLKEDLIFLNGAHECNFMWAARFGIFEGPSSLFWSRVVPSYGFICADNGYGHPFLGERRSGELTLRLSRTVCVRHRQTDVCDLLWSRR